VGCDAPQCGDLNHSGSVNLSDAVFLIAYMFGDGQPPAPIQSGDINCNGSINMTDIVYLIAWIFEGYCGPCDPDCDGDTDC
jgi:hypothetical protein